MLANIIMMAIQLLLMNVCNHHITSMLIKVNPRYVVGSVVVLLLVYWVPATLYTILDLFRPACLYKYKVISKVILVESKKEQIEN